MIDNFTYHAVSIPERVKGQEMTKAQSMLYWSNKEIEKKIMAQKEQAKEKCKEVLKKIKNGDFVSKKVEIGYYNLSVSMHSENNSEYFMDEVKAILEKKEFTFIKIDPEDGSWELQIKE